MKVSIFLLFYFLFFGVNICPQDSVQTINGYNYGKYGVEWYTLNDNGKADLVDLRHLIVRLMYNAEIDKFDNTKYNLSALIVTRDKFVESYYELEIPSNINAFEYAKLLEETNEFETILFNVFAKIYSVPNDPLFSYQWNLSKVDITNAWEISKGNSEIVIAVIDVGGDYNHEDLIGNKWGSTGGYDFIGNDSDPYPIDGAKHGTAVAGVIAARSNNLLGVSGIAGGWNIQSGVKLMHLRAGYILIPTGEEVISFSAATEAVEWAAENGADIVNMSFGYQQGYAPLITAINNAFNSYGVIFVAAAGNYFENSPNHWILFPASCENCSGLVNVGATIESDYRKTLNDGTDEPWWGSCYGGDGRSLDLSAPGIHIPTTDITGSEGYTSGNYYLLFNGTSAAAPLLSGLIGLLISANPSLDYIDIYSILTSSADKVAGMGGQNYHPEYGYGRINAFKALLEVINSLANENKSASYDATAHNNNHILERGFFGKLHEVFQSGGVIFYRRSSNNGSSWELTKRITVGNGSNNHPSIAAANSGSNDVLCLVWQKKIDSQHYDIMYSISSNMGTSWSTPAVVPGCSNVVVSIFQSGPGPTPVVAGFQGYNGPQGAFLLVYAAENGLHYRYSNSWFTGWIVPGNDIIPGSEGPLSKNWYPSLATYNSQDTYGGFSRVNLTYDNRYNNVYSQIFNYLNGTTSWTTRVQINSIGDNNRLSSIAVDYAGDRLAVWSGFNGSNFATRFRKGYANGTWSSWYKEWSVSGVNSLCPSVTYYNKGGSYPYGIDILWYTESTNPAILNKRYSGTGDSWIPSDPFVQVVSLNSSFPNVTHERQNSILPLQIWTDQSAQPYSISYNTVFVPKEELFTGGEIHRAAEISDTSNNSYLRIELSEPIITLTDGDEIKIPFKTYNYFDTLDITTENIFDYLKTELINIPNNAQSITFKVEINASQPDTLSDGTLNTDPQTPFRTINFGLVARDDSSRIILNNIGNRLLNNLAGIHHYSREFTITASALRRSNVQVIPNINLSGIFNQNNLYFALVNISIEGDSLGKGSPKSDENNAIPTDFSLEQNYPNPFNPVTQIDYSLVKDGLVTLKIFDVLGKEVTTLVNKEKQAGTYTVLFNAGNISSGIYFYQLKTKDYVDTKKMILLR